MKKLIPFLLILTALSCQKQEYEIVIRGGTVYDGTGRPGVVQDVAINADTVAFIGDLSNAVGRLEINAKGLAVAPGFINMLSHSWETLILDGRGQSDIRQGVTHEVLGEISIAPMSEAMKKQAMESMEKYPDFKYPIEWTTLGEYLGYLEKKGISQNISSFVGLNTVRVNELGYANRAPNAEEMERMKGLVKQAMEEGALGVTTALIYAPGNYATTEELIEPAKWPRRMAGCISPTCAAREIIFSVQWMRRSALREKADFPPKFVTSKWPARTTGGSWIAWWP
jgi:N-acyl-D-amino-acid deacylase